MQSIYHIRYQKLINHYKSMKLDGYLEKHHIVPKCMGGSNKPENLVALSAKSHYLAHLLLTKMYPNNSSLHSSFFCMSRTSKNQDREYITARRYEKMRESQRRAMIVPCKIGKNEFESHKEAAKHFGVDPTTITNWKSNGKTQQTHKIKCCIDGIDFISKREAARYFDVDSNTVTSWIKFNDSKSKFTDTTCIIDNTEFSSMRAAAKHYNVTPKVVSRWVEKNNGKSKPSQKRCITIDGKTYKSKKDAANHYGVSYSTIRSWESTGKSKQTRCTKKREVIVDDTLFKSLNEAARTYNVNSGTIHYWIQTGKAKYNTQ